MSPLVQLSFRGQPVYLDPSEIVAVGPEIQVVEFKEKTVYRVVYLRGGAKINIDVNERNMSFLLGTR